MHIGLVIYGDLDVISGGYLYDRQLVKYWRANGHQVTIFALPWRNYWRHLGDNFAYTWFRKVLMAQIDVLVQDELNHPSLLGLNLMLRQRTTIPIISLVHLLRSCEPHPKLTKRIFQQIERQYLRQMDGFILNSHDTSQAVKALCDCDKLNVVAYPGRDHWSLNLSADDIMSRAQTTGPLRILFVGNYIARKGLHVLLAALSGLDLACWCLTAVGRRDLEPEYVQQLEKMIDNNGLKDQVHLIGPRPYAAMPPFFQSHQLFVMPSFYEPFGIVYLEALGAGLPVIASAVGGGGELIKTGRNGYLVAPGDAAEIRQHVQVLSHDRGLLFQMGKFARADYEQHPTWMETGAKVTAFLQRIVT